MDEECNCEEDEKLDAALESVLIASLSTEHISLERKPSQSSTSTTLSPCESSPGPDAVPFRLIFSFPGWGVDISRDWKRRRPSVLRHVSKPAEEGPFAQDNEQKQAKNAPIVWCEETRPAHGCSVFELPDELLVRVLMTLELRDLCSVMQVCRRWHSLGSVDAIWERFSPFVKEAKDREAENNLSRWLFVKNYTLSSQISNRYTYFRKGYDHLRCALNDWWELGRPDGRYSSSTMHSLIRRLTAQDWTLVYEAFGAAFSHRTDCLASIVVGALEKAKNHVIIPSRSAPYPLDRTATKQASTKRSICWSIFNDETGENCESGDRNCDAQGLSAGDGPTGQDLWKLLYDLWNRYKYWLTLISNHCADLNHEVMVERARGAAFSATPTVYDKGVISFRNWMYLMTTLYVRPPIHK